MKFLTSVDVSVIGDIACGLGFNERIFGGEIGVDGAKVGI